VLEQLSSKKRKDYNISREDKQWVRNRPITQIITIKQTTNENNFTYHTGLQTGLT